MSLNLVPGKITGLVIDMIIRYFDYYSNIKWCLVDALINLVYRAFIFSKE